MQVIRVVSLSVSRAFRWFARVPNRSTLSAAARVRQLERQQHPRPDRVTRQDLHDLARRVHDVDPVAPLLALCLPGPFVRAPSGVFFFVPSSGSFGAVTPKRTVTPPSRAWRIRSIQLFRAPRILRMRRGKAQRIEVQLPGLDDALGACPVG